MVEPMGLQIELAGLNVRYCGFGEDIRRDVLDRSVIDLVNEADVVVFPGGHARDHVAPCHLGINHGLAPSPAIVDHHDKILHAETNRRHPSMTAIISEK